jgi:putative membrane protein
VKKEGTWLVIGTVGVLIWSGILPHDRLTWYMEVAPVLIGLPLLVATAKKYPLSPLLYRLLFLHGIILMVGGHYTYAEVPLGQWFQDILGLSRNHYDRLGHFAQGFVPAILAREILLRQTPLIPGRWLGFLCISICLAFSALYELIEWWAAIWLGQSAEAFLGTQGDVWDTQWDMFLALCGACLAMLFLSSAHNRSMDREWN